MRKGKNYVPCLRWKMGEYQALAKLSTATKNAILPIIDIAEFFKDAPGNSFDHEEEKPAKTIDQHLSKFAKRVKEKWGTNECFIDLRNIDTSVRMSDGLHPVNFVFNDLRFFQIKAIPIIGLDRDLEYRRAVRRVVTEDQRGLCLRASLEKATTPSYINNILTEMNSQPNECDFILDLGAPDKFEPMDVFTTIVETIIKKLPYLNEWRSFGVIGTSFPSSLSGIQSGLTFLPRSEWLLYKELVTRLKKVGIRIPTFGDYAINHPEIVNLDMRFSKPKANVRYTLNDRWLIARGESVRDHGFGQHQELCGLIINFKDYYGQGFSLADKYIYDCANGVVSTGNLSTWRWVGTNHHLEMVTRDIANLFAS